LALEFFESIARNLFGYRSLRVFKRQSVVGVKFRYQLIDARARITEKERCFFDILRSLKRRPIRDGK